MPGGGGNGGTTRFDAATDNDSGTTVSGQVCLAPDPRSPAVCSSTGAGDLSVTLGTASATTAIDGTFTMDRPASTDVAWNVSGTGIVPSVMAYVEGTKIPAIRTDIYDDMVVAMQATVSSATGAIIVRLAKSSSLVSGAVVTSSPSPDSLVYYDGPSITEWDLDSTGPFGVAWISSIAPGTGTLSIDTGATPTNVADIPLVAGAITFVFAEIP
jgi:hypothetical protein